MEFEGPAPGPCAGKGGGIGGVSGSSDPAMACCIVKDVCWGSGILSYKTGGGGIMAAWWGGHGGGGDGRWCGCGEPPTKPPGYE